ncbi:MAG: stage II sporulation protein E [Acidibacillus sp.]|uniref:Stage II sporulation protein E n=1 Tax=Sulfoacidibacillus ferrooxidans TaxID=2005001 RepID=A0A9X1V6U7_9BACL|nr:stage II sporulation protein E [Sulfoacidibacillus ferrooxidans]MCI0182601.1 Stage II sporulation protein E [Sulfoacidibacillus ferrooxidans]MCY0894127.1 stage II sporulation protein E [Acidibacillus sp.]
MHSKSKQKGKGIYGMRPPIHLVSATSESRAHTLPPQTDFSQAEPKRLNQHLVRIRFMLIALVVGYLMGRAVILDSLTPFALAGYAVSLNLRKGTSVWVGTGLLLGSISAMSAGANPLLLLAMLVSYRLLIYFFTRVDRIDVHAIPFLVFAVDAGFRIGFVLPTPHLTLYTVGMAVVDGILSFLLTLMFLQLPPLLSSARVQKQWQTDEVIGMVILLASLMTGLKGVSIHGISLEGVFARYLVVVFAAVGGAGIAGTVGIVTGVILSLGALTMSPLIGILGFAGVLAGMLREGKRFLIGIGFLVGSAILALYSSHPASAQQSLILSAIAVALFYITPKRMFEALARVTPGTTNHTLRQQEHVRRIKSMMTKRIEEVATVFSELGASFSSAVETPYRTQDVTDHAIEFTKSEICASCRRFERCWKREEEHTAADFKAALHQLTVDEELTLQNVPKELYSRCIKLERLLPALQRAEISSTREHTLLRQVRESRKLVASQLAGVGVIMRDLASEIEREEGASRKQESQIMAALAKLGLEVQGIDIVSLEEGKVEIEILEMHPSGHNECGKLVAPLLSEVLGETITVKKAEPSPDGSYQVVTLASAKRFQVSSGFASAAKDGTLQSGDFFNVVDVGNGRYALALSDGMGNGERAHSESSAAVTIVQQLLKAGFDESLAIKTVNSALLLRSDQEMYATLDLAVIDLYTAQTEFLKVGSVPSYIKQGKFVSALHGHSLPIGILSQIEVQTERIPLSEGDMVVFMSDGILEAVSHLQDPDHWIARQLERFDSDDPQIIADLLLESSVRAAGGLIKDDMTILCAKIETFKPEWATIHLPDLPTIRNRKGRARAKTPEPPRQLVQV